MKSSYMYIVHCDNDGDINFKVAYILCSIMSVDFDIGFLSVHVVQSVINLLLST